jgi:uncharacterized protein
MKFDYYHFKCYFYKTINISHVTFMITEDDLNFIISDQREVFLSKPQGVLRDLDMEQYLNTRQIVIISGIRRCGKSTLLRQFAQRLGNDFVYANFDDERLLNFEVSDFSALLTLWHKQSSGTNIIIDEIQNIPQWERFVCRIHDEGYKVFLSGSNSRLLSGELGTHLSGRYKQISLYPFSFAEYLDFAGITIKKTTISRAAVSKAFDDYLMHGGFPLYCLSKDEEILSTLYENIMYKDILYRYAIHEKKAFRELAHYTLSNTAKEFSYRNISRLLGIRSDTSTKNYLSYMEEAFLLFQVSKYDYSLKKQYVSNKKIYCIDNGLSTRVAFRISQDSGRLLENMVFIELCRRNYQVYFHRELKECDFVCLRNNTVVSLIQVCDYLRPENKKRETEGLSEAMKIYRLSEGYILTRGKSETITFPGTKQIIRVTNIIDWLLLNEDLSN